MNMSIGKNSKAQFSQVLEDLEVDYSDMMDNPKAFIARVYAKAQELARQLDAKSSLVESERTFKEKALKNKDAEQKAEILYEHIMDLLVDQDPEVLVHLLGMFPELTSTASNSVRSMAMRTGNVTSLSKRQINNLYIKLKDTYEAYINFMKLMHKDEIGVPPVIVAKKGNFSDYSANGIRYFEFLVDGYQYTNPFPVAKMLGIKIKFYMDLPDEIEKLQGGDSSVQINGHDVKLIDMSKVKDDE